MNEQEPKEKIDETSKPRVYHEEDNNPFLSKGVRTKYINRKKRVLR